MDEDDPIKRYHEGYFSVPSDWNTRDLVRGNERAVIVTVFGHSSIESKGYKSSPMELMLGHNLFSKDLLKSLDVTKETFFGIEGFYDPDNRVVFLHLNGVLDTTTIAKSLEKMNTQLQEKGFLMVWSELRVQYARALLLLFCTSHILLLCHPNHIFDITYIHLFQTLDNVRAKISSHLSEVLSDISGVSKDWQQSARMCSPRVLFIFSSRLIPLHILRSATTEQNRYNSVSRMERNLNPLRKLELDLEYQIYRLLRKSRVITNISYNSLFALPNNQPFVYILEDYQEPNMACTLIRDSLTQFCSPHEPVVTDFNKLLISDSYNNASIYKDSPDFMNRLEKASKGSFTPLSNISAADALSNTLLSSVTTERKRNVEHSFQLFLKQHIDEALIRGFDDNVGRHSGPVLFEVPKLNVWFEAFHKLFDAFISESPDADNTDGNPILSTLKTHLETDILFSDNRCAKVLPLAISAYKDGLPTHYNQAHHQSKLEMAMGILAAQARGPMYDKYVIQLEEACGEIWHDGRIGCETLSLTGNACQHPMHTTSKDESSSLPVMIHHSAVTYVSYCNCGHRKGQIEDPFTVREANYDFYHNLEELCCSRLEKYSFPAFKSSVVDAKAATVDSKKVTEGWSPPERGGNSGVGLQGSAMTHEEEQQSTAEGSRSPMDLSLEGTAGLSQGMSNSRVGDPATVDGQPDDSEIIVTVANEENEIEEDNKELNIHRQVSTTEYLPGMLTTLSPTGLLPQFSSWSLVCLGPSSLYSHNAGISDQPGFLSGTNFLLPWDVTIKIRDKDKWPAIADSMGKKGFLLKNKKNRMGGDLNEFNVKIFLGTEYQCMRGHRFMMASPDKPLKATSLGHVKETAVKVANSHMPLYFPCPCSRSGQVMNGQLMRLHVVTPKAPVHVTLNPQVQPAPDPCPIFIPQSSSANTIKLSASAYWVLRLPYSYVGDSGPYYPSRQATSSSYAKLIKGCYGISEITLDR